MCDNNKDERYKDGGWFSAYVIDYFRGLDRATDPLVAAWKGHSRALFYGTTRTHSGTLEVFPKHKRRARSEGIRLDGIRSWAECPFTIDRGWASVASAMSQPHINGGGFNEAPKNRCGERGCVIVRAFRAFGVCPRACYRLQGRVLLNAASYAATLKFHVLLDCDPRIAVEQFSWSWHDVRQSELIARNLRVGRRRRRCGNSPRDGRLGKWLLYSRRRRSSPTRLRPTSNPATPHTDHRAKLPMLLKS